MTLNGFSVKSIRMYVYPPWPYENYTSHGINYFLLTLSDPFGDVI